MTIDPAARATRDVDLGVVGVPLATLREAADELRAAGHAVELGEPGLDDPLGGVIRIEVSDELQVDVVNFGNPFTGRGKRVGEAALGAGTIPIPARRLSVVGVGPLVLLKLAAGSRLDLRDAAELLVGLARDPCKASSKNRGPPWAAACQHRPTRDRAPSSRSSAATWAPLGRQKGRPAPPLERTLRALRADAPMRHP